MTKGRPSAVLAASIVAMFLLSVYQLASAQKIPYSPIYGDDAGATCCIGRETCEMEQHPPCFYAVNNGALPTWYDCVAETCDLWPNTTCWADATKARHEMGDGGAYRACDYSYSYGANAAEKCYSGGCLSKEFYACVLDRCKVFDGSAADCEKDASTEAHKTAADCR